MNNFKKSALTVLIASALGFSGSLFAADEPKADAGVAQDPKLESLDKNHPAAGGEQQAAKDEDKGQAGPAGKDDAAATAGAPADAGASGNAHWGQIDTDSDNLVTPDEMEKFLQAKNNSGSAEPKATGAAGPTGDSGTPAPASKEGAEKDKESK